MGRLKTIVEWLGLEVSKHNLEVLGTFKIVLEASPIWKNRSIFVIQCSFLKLKILICFITSNATETLFKVWILFSHEYRILRFLIYLNKHILLLTICRRSPGILFIPFSIETLF